MNPVDELQTVGDFLRWFATALERADVFFGHGTDNAWDEALALVSGGLSLPPDKLEFVLASRLSNVERGELARLLERRIAHRVPVPYLVGTAWFCGRSFAVDAGVLIPRSPIGELIDRNFEPWVTEMPDRILDLCCGSGCIGIACAHAFPQATVVLCDIDPAACELARRNVVDHGVEDRVSVVQGDLFVPTEGPFDLVISNPPYVDAADLEAMPREFLHEPALALAGGADGLDVVRRIVTQSAERLTSDGLLVLEVGNGKAALEAAYPSIPFVWPALQRGGHGVSVVQREALASGVSCPTNSP